MMLDPATESARQRSVASYGLTGPGVPPGHPVAELTALTELAKRVLGADYAAVNILDGTCLHSIACSAGLQLQAVDQVDSLCQQVLDDVTSDGPLVRLHIAADPQLSGLPWTSDDRWQGIKSYCAVPLIGREGLLLGVLCVLSEQPRQPKPHQLKLLSVVGDAVMLVLETERLAREAAAPERPARRVASRTRAAAWTIDAIIDQRAVRTLFQPVVHLASGTVAGFEAWPMVATELPGRPAAAAQSPGAGVGRDHHVTALRGCLRRAGLRRPGTGR